jgi:Mce-associated membrane protein
VEDQPTDSDHLTTDAGPVPQGKANRTRHRLPRQKLRAPSEDASVDDASVDDAKDDSEVATEEPVAEAAEEASTESVAEETADEPAEPSPRRRFPWRRSKASSVADPVAADTETETGSTESGEDTEEAPDEPAPILVPHRTAGRALKIAAGVAAALFVGAAGFAGATVQPYLADRADVHTKFEVAETAANAISTLWTYTPEDMDSLPDRAGRYLTGDFAVEYKRYIDAIVEPNKQAQVSNNTQVLGTAVENLTPTEANVIVYTNSVATSPVTKGIPSLRYLSYRLTLEPRDRKWLITKMQAVSSLDLTPRM